MRHERAALFAWCIAEPQKGSGLSIHHDEAFETAADGCDVVDAGYAGLARALPARNRDVMAGNRAAQSGSRWLTHLRRFGQCALVRVRREHRARERMA